MANKRQSLYKKRREQESISLSEKVQNLKESIEPVLSKPKDTKPLPAADSKGKDENKV